jgi:hypothetical protein
MKQPRGHHGSGLSSARNAEANKNPRRVDIRLDVHARALQIMKPDTESLLDEQHSHARDAGAHSVDLEQGLADSLGRAAPPDLLGISLEPCRHQRCELLDRAGRIARVCADRSLLRKRVTLELSGARTVPFPHPSPIARIAALVGES